MYWLAGEDKNRSKEDQQGRQEKELLAHVIRMLR
jgi:hypothetical protein